AAEQLRRTGQRAGQDVRHGWGSVVAGRNGTRRIRFDRLGIFGGIMRRLTTSPRPNWEQKVEEVGLTWHTGEQVYWNESAYYEFTAKEVDVLEAATNELEKMTLAAAQHIIDNRLYQRMAIPEVAIPLIESSWEAE